MGTHYPDWTWPQDEEMDEATGSMFQAEEVPDSEATWFAISTWFLKQCFNMVYFVESNHM